MLVIGRPSRGARSDDGAVLVTVVVVMLVGFIIATVIAASVMVTVRENAANTDRTQAFVAAESGRDVAYAAMIDGCVIDDLADGGAVGSAGETFAYTVEVTDEGEPTDPADRGAYDGLTAECPGEDTATVLISSTGTGADGSTAELLSVYPWETTLVEQPGGTMAFFDGRFKTTGSGYVGDLVVRTGDYNCSNDAVIQGDLWVVGGETGAVDGDVTLSSGCVVTGSIYAAGTVTSSSQPVSIGGDIVALRAVSLKSDGMTIGGDVYSGTNVSLDGTGSTDGTIGGDVLAFGTLTPATKAALVKWVVAGDLKAGEPKPTFDPALRDVYDMTTWADLGISTTWRSVDFPAVEDTSCPADPDALLGAGTDRLLVNLTACASGPPASRKVSITLDGATLTRDVMFLVPANAQMNVAITGNIASSSSPDPQLWFVHSDSTTSDNEPVCGNGTQDDKFDVESGKSIRARILVYTACGLTGTIKSDFSGQIYVNDDTRTVSANFVCTPMSWEPAMPNLSCRIRGAGGAAGEPIETTSIGDLLYQTER